MSSPPWVEPSPGLKNTRWPSTLRLFTNMRGVPPSSACSTLASSGVPQRRRTCTVTFSYFSRPVSCSGERLLISQLRLPGLAWATTVSRRWTSAAVASSELRSARKPGVRASWARAWSSRWRTCGACLSCMRRRSSRSRALSIFASASCIGTVHQGCTSTAYTKRTAPSSRPRASQRSRLLTGACTGVLLGGRADLGGEGEAVLVRGRIGLQRAGERRVAPQRRVLQAADQRRGFVAQADQGEAVLLDGQFLQEGAVGQAAAELVHDLHRGRGLAALVLQELLSLDEGDEFLVLRGGGLGRPGLARDFRVQHLS